MPLIAILPPYYLDVVKNCGPRISRHCIQWSISIKSDIFFYSTTVDVTILFFALSTDFITHRSFYSRNINIFHILFYVYMDLMLMTFAVFCLWCIFFVTHTQKNGVKSYIWKYILYRKFNWNRYTIHGDLVQTIQFICNSVKLVTCYKSIKIEDLLVCFNLNV